MSYIYTDDQHYHDIASAIRNKNGTQNTYTPSEMPAAIAAIPSGSGGQYEALVPDLLDRSIDESPLVLDYPTIGKYAFYGCSSLTNITLTADVESVEANAFYSTGRPCSVTIEGERVLTATSSSFGSATDLTIYVPATQLAAYQAAEPYASTYSACLQAISE